MKKLLFAGIGAALVFSLSASQGFSQVPALQNRIPQQIVINGQLVPAAYVMASGGETEAFSCPAPQPYVTPDGVSQGWACYDPSTGVWLLNAVPPAEAQVAPAPLPQQPAVIYQQAPPPVIYQEPAPVIYRSWPRRVAVAPAYPPSVVLGSALINAAGRIASAAIIGSHRPEPYRYTRVEPNHYVHVEPNHYGHATVNRYSRGSAHDRH